MLEFRESEGLAFKVHCIEVEHLRLAQLALQAGQGFFDRVLVVAVEEVEHSGIVNCDRLTEIGYLVHWSNL